MLRWLLRVMVGRPGPKTVCRYWYEVECDAGRVAVGFQTFQEMVDYVDERSNRNATIPVEGF